MNVLKDKVAIVTGASSGIGYAAAKLFALEGAKVVVAGRRKTGLDALVGEIASAGCGKGGTASLDIRPDRQMTLQQTSDAVQAQARAVRAVDSEGELQLKTSAETYVRNLDRFHAHFIVR